MLLTLACLLAAGATGAGDKDARAAFDRMEAVVLKAKTFQADFVLTATAGKEAVMDLKGRVAVATGNRLRLEFDGKMRTEVGKISLVSDGAMMRMTATGMPGPNQDVEKQLTEILLASASRTGFFFPMSYVEDAPDGKDEKKPFAIDTDLAVSDFKLGKKETVAGAEAQAVEYLVKPKRSKDAVAVTVWIDAKTNLPVKRVLVAKQGEDTITMTETYAKGVVDGKIDEKEFAILK